MAQLLDAAADPWEGKTLVQDKYRLDTYVQRASTGRIYDGIHVSLDRPVRLKLLDASHAADDQLITRFTKEARAAARIDHPSVVRVLDFGREPDGPFYLVTEQVEGKTLQETVEQDGPFEFEVGLELAAEIVSGVAEAHERGVFHRNLTPGAIIIHRDRDGRGRVRFRPKLTDFDMAKLAFQPSTATLDMLPGNPRFMAPEQYKGNTPDARSDVYALSCIIYYILTGGPPFDGKNAIEILHQHAHASPTTLSEIYGSEMPSLDRVLTRGLEKDPDRRTSNGRHLLHELRDAIQQTPAPEKHEIPIDGLDVDDEELEADAEDAFLPLALRIFGVILLSLGVGSLAWFLTVWFLSR